MKSDGELARMLTLACDHLGMQAAYISELTPTQQVFRAVAGRADALGLVVDEQLPRTETYCDLMVSGRLANVVPDTAADPLVRDLAITRDAPVGAYVGVPLTLSTGELYGTFCCVSATPDPHLDERDAKFLRLLASLVIGRVEASQAAAEEYVDVRDVLDTAAIEIALQPIVDLTTGQWQGVEALARFPGSSRRVDEMFALADRAGCGADLELLALRLALRRLADVPPGGYLAVNMSPNGLTDPRFPEVMAQCSDLSRIVLEITEHAPVDQYAALLAVLAPLRQAGMRVAVDDVGAGYASFRHVLQLHPDVLKIDKSLVSGIAEDSALRTIASNLVLLALDLRASVVAEGVEAQADLDVLEVIGADMAQGYLFARPSIDPADWATWAARDPRRAVSGASGAAAGG